MIELPLSCAVDKFISKKTFYGKVNISSSIKEEFTEKLNKIYWKYKISEDTINISKTDNIEEIEIFDLELKEKYNCKNLIRTITKNIPYPILFCVKYEDEFQYAIKYHDDIFFSKWNEKIKFNCSGINLETIYNNIVKCIANIDKNVKNIDAVIQKQKELEKINKEIMHIENLIRKEKQFNIKIELNIKLLELKKEMEELKHE